MNASQIVLSVETRADQLRTACILECTAAKPGNVFPGHPFADVCYEDFVRSADISAPILARSNDRGVGTAILEAARATRIAVGSNTNLGMILLLAPLAAVPKDQKCFEGIEAVLRGIDLPQTRLIYEAIRLAQPGGLGKADTHDVAEEPTVTILTSMAAAPQDRIAWQYTHTFEDILQTGRNLFLDFTGAGMDWETALIRTHLEFLARQSDSLILRKCGEEIARETQLRAKQVLSCWKRGELPPVELKQFDEWLRGDGHRRNPGTTADLLAGMLFALLRDEEWFPPRRLTITGATFGIISRDST